MFIIYECAISKCIHINILFNTKAREMEYYFIRRIIFSNRDVIGFILFISFHSFPFKTIKMIRLSLFVFVNINNN